MNKLHSESIALPIEFTENLFGRFEAECSHKVRQAIESKIVLDDLLQELSIKGLDRKQFNDIMFEHEMAFCRHILSRLGQCQTLARQTVPKDRSFCLQISTTMLYDIDETLYTNQIDIRPSAPFLLHFLREQGVDVGIVTTRAEDAIVNQLSDPHYLGSLTPVAREISAGVYAGIQSFNPRESRGDKAVEIIEGFETVETELEVMARVLKIGVYNLINALKRPGVMEELNSLIVLKRAELLFSNDDKEHGNDRSRYIERNEQQYNNLGFSEKLRGLPMLIQSAVETGVASDAKGILYDIVKKWNEIQQEEDHILEIRIKNRQKSNEFYDKLENLSVYKNDEPVEKAIVIDPAMVVVRLMAGLHELESEREPYVVITVDDKRDAEVIFDFFMGKVRDAKGRDGYTFFNLEKYRNRIFSISCKDGEYSRFAIKRRVQKTLSSRKTA